MKFSFDWFIGQLSCKVLYQKNYPEKLPNVLHFESQSDSFGMILQWNSEILKTIESFAK